MEVTGGVLSRPVSPKLAHEAVLAKPPYVADASTQGGVQNGVVDNRKLKMEIESEKQWNYENRGYLPQRARRTQR